MFPLYVAGDDIFFAVHVSNVIRAVDLLGSFLKRINHDIDQKLGEKQSLTMRVGIDITWSSQPIRYYYDRVEHQMAQTKKDWQDEKNPYLKKLLRTCPVKICIDESVFYCFADMKAQKSIEVITNRYLMWNNMENAVKLIQFIKSKTNSEAERDEDDSEINSFLYNLLAKVTDPAIINDDIRLSNAVLYHMRPEFVANGLEMMNPKQKVRLELYKFLQSALCTHHPVWVITEKEENGKGDQKKQKKKKGDYEMELVQDFLERFDFSRDYRDYLIKHFLSCLRILLMFSDPRFSIKITPINFSELKEETKSTTKILLKRTQSYIKTKNLTPTALREIFIQDDSFKNEKNKIIPYTLKLNIEPSMIYRFKYIMQRMENPLYEICNMIDKKQDILQKLEEKSRNEKSEKREPIKFNSAAFLEAAEGNWNDDFIDSLIIFYRYSHLQKKWKRENAKQKENKGVKKNNYNQKNKRKGR